MRLKFTDLFHPIEFLKEELMSRARAQEKIDGKAWTTLYHVYKCLVATDEELFNHWASEIYIYYLELAGIRLKPSKRKPSTKMFFEALFNEEFCNPAGVLSEEAFIRLSYSAKKQYESRLLNFSVSRNVLIVPMNRFYTLFSAALSNDKIKPQSFIVDLLTSLRVGNS